jgi:hypothetical protein
MRGFKKLKTIINSRFKTTKEQPTDWLKKRRETCLGCEYNSLNKTHRTFVQTFLATLSYFYSWLFNRADKDHKSGVCTICYCPIELKIKETEEEYLCEHPDGNKWNK